MLKGPHPEYGNVYNYTAVNGQNECYLAYESIKPMATSGTVRFYYDQLRWPAGEYEVRYFLGDADTTTTACRTTANAPDTPLGHCVYEAVAEAKLTVRGQLSGPDHQSDDAGRDDAFKHMVIVNY